MTLNKRHKASVLKAIRTMEQEACRPVVEANLLFRCLSSNQGERTLAVEQLLEMQREELMSGKISQSLQRLRKLESARQSTRSHTAPPGYEEIWRVTRDPRQGAIKVKTREKTLVVLHAVKKAIEPGGGLPTQVEVIHYLKRAVGESTVSDVFQELAELSGLRFPGGRDAGNW